MTATRRAAPPAAHLLHHQRVHDVEDVPGQPDGAVLREEGSALEAQR